MAKIREDNPKKKSDAQEIDINESFSTEQPDEADVIEITEDTDLKKLFAEKEDQYLRVVAEFDNYKKRIIRQHDELVHNAEAGVLKKVIEVVDNLERALGAADDEADTKAFKDGVKMILGQMKKILDDHDVSQIETVGNPFDPELHEAVMQVETAEHPEGIIAQELSGGYKKGKKVIRHAKVGVSGGRKK